MFVLRLHFLLCDFNFQPLGLSLDSFAPHPTKKMSGFDSIPGLQSSHCNMKVSDCSSLQLDKKQEKNRFMSNLQNQRFKTHILESLYCWNLICGQSLKTKR